VAAAGLNPSLNPTSLLLVNDLDIRLKRLSDNTTFSPYILNPSSPASAATTGDNFRDNVEQIFIAAPQAGIYTITVSHKGTLFSSTPQAFSLIISGVAGPPSAAFSASTISACTAQQVTFTDNSSGSPTSRVWYFPGGNPATSTALNPVVTYAVAGKYAVALKASNGLGSDSIYSTNYITIGGLSLPFTENFESTSATLSSWQIDNPNNDTTWKLTTTQGTTPGNTSYVIPYYNDSARGKRDGLISPVLSLKGYQSTSLTFKYAYTRYSTTSKDSLIVYISNNCGNTWTRLLARGESGTGTFATAPNSTYLSTSYFTPTGSSNWCGGGTGASCPTISLNAYAGQSNIRIKFEGYNDYGNNIYIDNISITGTPLKPVAGFRALKTIVCLGDSVMLSDTSANFPSAWTWTFSGGLPATSTLKNPSVYYNNPGTYPVKLRVSNVSGADSVTINGYITVVAPPSVPTISANKALVICVGDSVLLTCDSNASAYSWYTGSSILPIAGATGKTLYAKADGAYTVEVSNANGCKTKSVPTSLTVNPLPPQPIISSSITGTAFCTGGTAQLTSNAANGNQWYKNNVVVSGANTNTFQTTDSGSYTVQVTANGCKSLMSAPKVLGLYPKPSTSNISGPLTSNYNRTENYSVTGISGSTYTWSIVNGSQTGGTNTNSVSIKWAVADTGYITVRETATTGCKGDFRALAIPLSIGVGLPSIDLITQLTVFPNPANDAIHLAFDNISSKPVTLQLQNMLGQVLYEQMIAHQGKYESRIDLSNIPAGVYMLSINTEDGYKKQTKISVRR
jgi:PKD repeat protein